MKTFGVAAALCVALTAVEAQVTVEDVWTKVTPAEANMDADKLNFAFERAATGNVGRLGLGVRIRVRVKVGVGVRVSVSVWVRVRFRVRVGVSRCCCLLSSCGSVISPLVSKPDLTFHPLFLKRNLLRQCSSGWKIGLRALLGKDGTCRGCRAWC
jgi:hypothetical protein